MRPATSLARETCPLPSANIYTDPVFLGAVADVYYPGHRACIRDYAVAGEVYRLLDVVGKGPCVRQRFVDVNCALGTVPTVAPPLPALPRMPGAGLPLTDVKAFTRRPDWQALDGAPLTLWLDFATWDDYLALLTERRVLAEDQRRWRKLQRHAGPIEFQIDDHARDVLPTCFDWKSARDRMLQREDLFADPSHRRFFQALADRGVLRASTLRFQGHLLAIWLGSVHDGCWSGWIFAFNPDPIFARFSPGRQLLYHMLEASFAAGHRLFDFSIGIAQYKLDFATHVRPVGLAGRPVLGQRASAAARHWLAQHPWMRERVRALRRHLPGAHSSAPQAGASRLRES